MNSTEKITWKVDEFVKERGHKSVVCFDFFDTLVTRKVMPEYTKKIASRQLSALFGQKITGHDFYKKRRSLEAEICAENLAKGHDQEFNLIDDYGNVSNFKIPLFSNVLEWCKEKNVILTVDLKRSVSQETVIKAIREAKAEGIVIIITYDVAQAKTAYKLAPDLLLSVSARNNDEFDRLLKAKIPTQNMLAFTGTRLSNPSLYKRLHEKDIVCMLGTLGNLDKQAKARGDELYKTWKNKGVDILATDRPFEAFNAIN